MGVVLRCEGDVQVDALTVVDFIMLCVVCLVSRLSRIFLLVSRGCYSLLVINLLTIN